jgi:hypothetical protein
MWQFVNGILNGELTAARSIFDVFYGAPVQF